MRDARTAEPDTSTPAPEPRISTRSIELAISYVLRAGVLMSSALIVLGLFLFIIGRHGPDAPGSFTALVNTHAAPVTLADVLRGSVRLHAIPVIQLGLLVLLMTPVVRVAMTVLIFVVDGDLLFFAIVCTVLFVLILGLSGAIG